MSDTNDNSNSVESNYDQEYERYMRNLASMDANIDDINTNGFDESFIMDYQGFTSNELPGDNIQEPDNNNSTVLAQSMDVAVEQSPLSGFLINKSGQDHYKNELKKRDLTTILKEFIAVETQNGSEQNAPLTKTNGNFYTKSELNVAKALKDFGLSENQIELDKNKFHFEPIGRIGSTKGSFDAYVMALKDNIEPQTAKDLKKSIDQIKAETVQQYIDSQPKQDEVVKNLIGNAKHYAELDKSKKNSNNDPFISVGDVYFLNPKEMRNHFDNIEGVEGNYKLINILPAEESAQYSYPLTSDALNSHFKSQLGLYKVITKNPGVLSQADLEQKISDNLQHLNSPILSNVNPDEEIKPFDEDNNKAAISDLRFAPSSIVAPGLDIKPEPNKSIDDIYEGEKVEAKVKPEKAQSVDINSDKTNETPKNPNKADFIDSIDHDEVPKSNKELDDSSEPKEKKFYKTKQQKSIAEIAIDAASKVTQAAIAAALALAKMLLKLILEALKMLFSGVSRLGRCINSTIPLYDHGLSKGFNNMSNHLAGTIPTFKNSMDGLKFNNGQGKQAENKTVSEVTKDLIQSRKEKNAKKLEAALSAGYASSPISESTDRNNKDQKADLKFDPLANYFKNEFSNTDQPTPETLKSLETDVKSKLNGFDDQMKKDFINSIPLEILHSTSPDLIDKLNDKTVYHDKNGILLGEGDKVTSNSLKGEYAVLAAYENGSELKYALAKEDPNGEYTVEIRNAKDLQLEQHNAYSFDNKDSLQNLVVEKFNQENDGFSKVELLNNQKPQHNALSIAEVLGKKHPIEFDDILEQNRSSIMDALDLENAPIVPSLHKQGISENPNDRMSHPTLHRLLDINDTVEVGLKGNKLSGVVVGAQLDKGVLNYQIKIDGNFFNCPAQNTTSTGFNNGGLTENEIAAIHAQAIENIPIISPNAIRVPLGSELIANLDAVNKGVKEILFSGKNNEEIESLIKDRTSTNEFAEFHDLKPLPILVEKLNPTTNIPEYFVAIGGVGDRENAQALMVEINKNIIGEFSVKAGAKPKIEDLNDSDIKRIIPFNGKAQRLSSHLLSDYAVAFDNGRDRQLQNTVESKLADSPEIATNLRNEYYSSNMAVAYLLKEQAQNVVKTPVELGANANLNNATVNATEPKYSDKAPVYMQAAPTFDTAPEAPINQSAPSANAQQTYNFVPEQNVQTPFTQNRYTASPKEASIESKAKPQQIYTFVNQQNVPKPYFQDSGNSVSAPIKIVKPVENKQAPKLNVLNYDPSNSNLTQEKVASVITKFENNETSPYQNGLQLKSMLNGVYADKSFERIKEHQVDATQSLTSVVRQFAEITGVDVKANESPYETLNNVLNSPDANEKIKNHFDGNPQDMIQVNQQLKDSIISTDLYNKNLENYTKDIADSIKFYTSATNGNVEVENDYAAMINDADKIFEFVSNEAIINSKLLNDTSYISKELMNGNSIDNISKELQSDVRNVNHDFIVNTNSITSTLQNVRESNAYSVRKMQTNDNAISKDKDLNIDNGLGG